METIEVVVARIGKPHGVRGEVTVDVRTDEPDRRFALGTVLRAEPATGSTSPLRQVTVSRSRWHQTRLLLTFEEINGRDEAEAARGIVLHATINADETPDDPDEYYDHQLVGLVARDLDGAHARRGHRARPRWRPGPARASALPTGAPRWCRSSRRWSPRSTCREASSWWPTGRGWSRRCRTTTSEPVVRIDVLTIFPAYLAPLELSLAGKARDKGLLDIRVHDLRTWAHDRHHTVDDTPYGGGAGMVLKPEPWGEAFDELADRRRHRHRHHARRASLHPGARPRPGHPRAAGLRLRPLRRHRPARDRPRRHPGRGPGGVHR